MSFPERDCGGLHWREAERDACGVGFVTSTRGERSHRIVDAALTVLANLEHRGAAASDPLTGDGAGILLAIPHELFVATCPAIDLVAPGAYGVGMFFLPLEESARATVVALVERVVREEGQIVLGWREVPVRPDHAGPAARASMPHVAQLLVGPGTLPADDAALDRKLYVIRKRIEAGARALPGLTGEYPYVASLSTRTVVYKGLLTPEQLPRFYVDLADERTKTPLAIVHQRFSTNTFPSWSRAHPYRRVAHNGEINTLRGNVAWMKAREPVLEAGVFGEDVRKLFPVIDEEGSDSAMFDDVLELLVHTGRSLPHAMMMMIPEAWERDDTMDRARRGFYAYHASVMEPWDGPACIAFSDGRYVGAVLDRNGLRPARWATTSDGLVVMASETGVLELAPETITAKRRLTPGRMLLVDTREGRIVEDAELKAQIAARRPYGRWATENATPLEALAPAESSAPVTGTELRRRERLFGVTEEDVRSVLGPMAERGEEPVGSMGKDSPPAILSDRPQLFFSYFRQLFAQVTNPPIDPIREALVMSLRVALGPEANLFEESPLHAKKLVLDGPIVDADAIARVRAANDPARGIVSHVLRTVYAPGGGAPGLEATLAALGREAELAVRDGATILVLSDRDSTRDEAPLPSLLALAAISQHLVDVGLRHRAGIVVESGEVREVMHVALLLGFGAGAVAPWLADAITKDLAERGALAQREPARAIENLHHALEKGVLKVMSKMGISTLSSYRGARIFEALGVSTALLDRWFGGMRSTIGGIGTFELAEDCAARHRAAWRAPALPLAPDSPDEALDPGGLYRFRRRGERHSWNPGTLALLQHAVRSADRDKFRAFQRRVDDETKNAGFLRGLLEFVPSTPIPIESVEPVSAIVKRFKTGAMSFGSISKEAHETLAVAMNRLGGRSNSGEGGEDPERYVLSQDGTNRRSAIKQVASGRFGVTLEYLTQADEIQIKIAQGAKPGEGGQLPGDKVDEAIAKTRHATPGVQLISPPPHHDIYSIEDLAELIHDLKNANKAAHVSVKLVAESGVGTIAAGVAKAKADVIVVSGDAGGTGAAPLGSVQHAGIPWEIGLAEAQQVLTLNGLRDRVRLETDGQLKTARDVVIATLLGAEEMAFGTAALVASGCVMMRVCHLNSCPVGVATQDPELRARFTGQPEHVMNFFVFLAEEVRALMAELGFTTMAEMVGRVERLRQRQGITHRRAQTVDLSRLLVAPPPTAARRKLREQDHELELALDTVLLEEALPAIERREPIELAMPIRNVNRTTATLLSSEIVRRHGAAGLPDATVRLRFTGSAGQSFGAFLAAGVELVLEGDANDGAGKGLSGGRIVVFPPAGAGFVPEENVIVGNVALYGATSGEAFFRGIAGERFAVRNSGATAVVEGAGDHACEYMTGGVVVVLGGVGRNFAAGMSGGVAYVLEREGEELAKRVNPAMVEMLPLDETDLSRVRSLVHKHFQRTQSQLAWRILSGWRPWSRRFVKVAPRASAGPPRAKVVNARGGQ